MLVFLTGIGLFALLLFLFTLEVECDKEKLGYTCHHRENECNKPKLNNKDK